MDKPKKEMIWEVTQVFGDPQPSNTTVTVFAARIEPKLASTLIKKLSTCAPLPSLGHVKRVRKIRLEDQVELSVILCLAPHGNCTWSLCKVPPAVKEVVEDHKLMPFIATVSQREACSREEWQEQCRFWPTSYHPNAVKLHQALTFAESQVEEICKFMRAAVTEAKVGAKCGQPANGAVIVDPTAGVIVSAGHDETGGWSNATSGQELDQGLVKGCSCTKRKGMNGSGEPKLQSWHPLRHAVMVAIGRAAEKKLAMKEENEPFQAENNRLNPKRRCTSETNLSQVQQMQTTSCVGAKDAKLGCEDLLAAIGEHGSTCVGAAQSNVRSQVQEHTGVRSDTAQRSGKGMHMPGHCYKNTCAGAQLLCVCTRNRRQCTVYAGAGTRGWRKYSRKLCTVHWRVGKAVHNVRVSAQDKMECQSNVAEQYLCTGLDVYVAREPCSMCAMALLHQRVRRVFYGIQNRQVGAVSGLRRLHGRQGLNHHYLVFHVALCEEDLQ